MADWPSARDEDRLPWLEPFGEGEQGAARASRCRGRRWSGCWWRSSASAWPSLSRSVIAFARPAAEAPR